MRKPRSLQSHSKMYSEKQTTGSSIKLCVLPRSRQGASIEQVANKMKRLRLIPQSWHPSDPLLLATPPSTPLSPAREATPPRVALRPSFPEPEPEGGDTVDHEKAEKLRDHLSNIVHIPMQRVKPSKCCIAKWTLYHYDVMGVKVSTKWRKYKICTLMWFSCPKI